MLRSDPNDRELEWLRKLSDSLRAGAGSLLCVEHDFRTPLPDAGFVMPGAGARAWCRSALVARGFSTPEESPFSGFVTRGKGVPGRVKQRIRERVHGHIKQKYERRLEEENRQLSRVLACGSAKAAELITCTG